MKSPHKSFSLVLFQFGEGFGTMLCKILSQGGDQILEILIGKDPINPIHSIYAHNYQGTIPTNYHFKKSSQQNQNHSCIAMSVNKKSHYDLSRAHYSVHIICFIGVSTFIWDSTHFSSYSSYRVHDSWGQPWWTQRKHLWAPEISITPSISNHIIKYAFDWEASD